MTASHIMLPTSVLRLLHMVRSSDEKLPKIARHSRSSEIREELFQLAALFERMALLSRDRTRTLRTFDPLRPNATAPTVPTLRVQVPRLGTCRGRISAFVSPCLRA
jgi:hypothetical protein